MHLGVESAMFIISQVCQFTFRGREVSAPLRATASNLDIALHQLFLMRYWPNVSYSGNTYSFEGVYPDVFSFYHFILRNTPSPRIYSTVCSAEYAGLNTNLSRGELTRRLSDWF